jgi:hypothetical protein
MRTGSIKPVVDRLDAERTASEAAKEESSQAKDVDVYTLLDLLLEPVRARDGALSPNSLHPIPRNPSENVLPNSYAVTCASIAELRLTARNPD